MRILTRYILRETSVFFLVALFAFTGVLITIRMLQFASLIINKGVSFSQIADVFIAIVPTFLEIALPMACLLAVMLAFARLSGDSEIIVLRANGIGLFQLIRPLLIFGGFIAACALYISVFLRPWGNAKLSESLFQIAQSRSTAGLSSGVFNKLGPITLYAEKIGDRDGSLQRVLIDDKRDETARKLVIAKTGTITSDPRERNIVIRLFDGYIHEKQEKGYVITDFSSNNLVLNMQQLFSTDDSGKEKKSREMYLPELNHTIDKYAGLLIEAQKAGGDFEQLPQEAQKLLAVESIRNTSDLKRKIRRLKIEAWRRFSMPYATFILALLAMPLGIVPPRTQRTWGAGLSVALGLVVFLAYYILLSLGITFGESGKIDPLLALWLPNIVATGVTAYILYKITLEKWPSIAHGFELGAERIRSILRFKQRRKP
ncbi:MAG: LPS export ABC transporter permease LptF [Deltaproteobacteria bacterium]|nr:LPS export ABC transporter permease LptF [Deltaproteobacteria bacterium]